MSSEYLQPTSCRLTGPYHDRT